MTPPPLAERLHSEPGLRWLRRAVAILLLLGLCSFLVRGADRPADPYLLGAGSSGPRTLLAGFEETRVTVRSPVGDLLSWCLLLARTAAQHQRGLMEVTDPSLGGYDGMLFRFDTDHTGQFWMRNTPMPLSIAYVDAAGQLVSTADMAPCEDRSDCPLYPAAAPYRTAIEVPQGGLARLGIGPGATVTDDRTACS